MYSPLRALLFEVRGIDGGSFKNVVRSSCSILVLLSESIGDWGHRGNTRIRRITMDILNFLMYEHLSTNNLEVI
jgi:hypothetical protein